MTDDQNDDDQRWLNTVLKDLGERSEAVKQALVEAVKEREGASALLGLESTTTENTEKNLTPSKDLNQTEQQIPLLGTNDLKSLNKSSEARSSDPVCYDSLLRFGAHNSDLSIRNTVRNSPRGCYGLREPKQLRIATTSETASARRLEPHV